jgi:hypothetical protein
MNTWKQEKYNTRNAVAWYVAYLVVFRFDAGVSFGWVPIFIIIVPTMNPWTFVHGDSFGRSKALFGCARAARRRTYGASPPVNSIACDVSYAILCRKKTTFLKVFVNIAIRLCEMLARLWITPLPFESRLWTGLMGWAPTARGPSSLVPTVGYLQNTVPYDHASLSQDRLYHPQRLELGRAMCHGFKGHAFGLYA